MFNWRFRRQVIPVLLFLLVAGGLVYFFASVFVLPAPVCTDGRKNGGETEVDCGGPCEPCEVRNPKEVKIFWTKAVPVREGVYDAVAYIENTNEVLSSRSLNYEFTLYDSFGPVGHKEGHTFLFDQESSYIVETHIETKGRPTRAEFELTTPNEGWEFRREPHPALIVERQDYKIEEDNGVKQSVVEVRILNNTPFDYKEAEVRLVILDAHENVLAVNKVILERLLAGQRRTIRSIWPMIIPAESIAHIIVEPRVNIFDPSMILTPQ